MTYANPLVESGEYEPVYAGDIEPGALLAAYGDARVSWVTPYPGERVTFGLVDVPGGVTCRRDTVLLVKVGSMDTWTREARNAECHCGHPECGAC